MDVLIAKVVVVVRTGVAEVATVSTCSVAAVAGVLTLAALSTALSHRVLRRLPFCPPCIAGADNVLLVAAATGVGSTGTWDSRFHNGRGDRRRSVDRQSKGN